MKRNWLTLDCFPGFYPSFKLPFSNTCFWFCLFRVLHRFQQCRGHITTGSWKGRGNQYIEFVRVVYCKLPTNGKQLPAFPLEALRGSNPSLRGGRRECYHSATVAPNTCFWPWVGVLTCFDSLNLVYDIKPQSCNSKDTGITSIMSCLHMPGCDMIFHRHTLLISTGKHPKQNQKQEQDLMFQKYTFCTASIYGRVEEPIWHIFNLDLLT